MPTILFVGVGSLLSDRDTTAPSGARSRDAGRARRLAVLAALGVAGSGFLALASDLPASPYGPRASGVWPLSGSARPPGWEGPAEPTWAGPANFGPGVAHVHLLVLTAAVLGLALLATGWLLAWRLVRSDPTLGWRSLWWVVATWTAPLLLAAPFASQDVWVYVAQGKVAASGLSASTSIGVLGHHSAWLSAVDPRYLTGPSIYGPGAFDLSGLTAVLSGGHPWIAVEGWRVLIIAALVLCGWGVARAATVRGSNPTEAVVAGVANPAVLIVFVGGIHNDALMIGLVVAGVACAVAKRPWWALCLAALAVTVKAPAGLAVLAIAWWSWQGSWRRRSTFLLGGIALTGGALVVGGMVTGSDGFGWLRSASQATVASSFSLLNLTGNDSSRMANLLQLAGIAIAVGIVLGAPSAGELGRRARARIRSDGGLRHEPTALVCPLGPPAPRVHRL